QSAHAAFCSRLRVGFVVAQQQPVRRLRLVQNVRAKLVSLRIVTRPHPAPVLRQPVERRLLPQPPTARAVQAPAKINLTLEVLARRADGYHGIRSVMVPLELSDELTTAPNDAFAFKCDR